MLWNKDVRHNIHKPVCFVGLLATLWVRLDIIGDTCAQALNAASAKQLGNFNVATILALSFFACTLSAYLVARDEEQVPGMMELWSWKPKSNKWQDYIANFCLWAARSITYILALVYYHLSVDGQTIREVMDDTLLQSGCTGSWVAPYTAFEVSVVSLYLVAGFELICLVNALVQYYSSDSKMDSEPALTLRIASSMANLPKASFEWLYCCAFSLAAFCAFAISWSSLEEGHFCSSRITEHSQIALVCALGIINKLWTEAKIEPDKPKWEVTNPIDQILFQIVVSLFFVMQFSLYSNIQHHCDATSAITGKSAAAQMPDTTTKNFTYIGTYAIGAAGVLFILYQFVKHYSGYFNGPAAPVAGSTRAGGAGQTLDGGAASEVQTRRMISTLNHPEDLMSNQRLIDNSKKDGEIELQFV